MVHDEVAVPVSPIPPSLSEPEPQVAIAPNNRVTNMQPVVATYILNPLSTGGFANREPAHANQP